MPAIDLSILNQRQTPAFYADILANRPAAGFIGRIFVSTNTFAFFRDNGTSWDLIGGPGTGTVTGTGANGQVTYWNGASTITGSNDLFFDSVNGHLGIGTIIPGTALDVKHDQSTVVQLEQETATNDIRIAFINSGVGLWRLGSFYNAGANDFGLFDIAAATQPVTVKRTTGQVLIGTSTVGSGKLVVASSTGDNGVQIVGAAAPSLRIDNAESGPTKRAGLGISTATNNFIQGSADRDFCMFNGSTTASPILFGIYDTTNVQEAARISAARNFLIGTTTDGGQRLQISGGARATGYYLDGMIAGSGALYFSAATNRVTLANYNASGILDFEVNGGASAMTINASGNLGLGITPNTWTGTNTKAFQFGNTGALGNSGTFGTILFNNSYYDSGYKYITSNPASAYVQDGSQHIWYSANAGTGGAGITFVNTMNLSSTGGSQARLNLLYNFYIDNDQSPEIVSYVATSGTSIQRWLQGTSPTETMRLSTSKNLLIGTTTDNGNRLQVSGSGGIYITTPTTAGTEIGLTIQNVSSTNSGVQQKFKNGFGDLAGIKASQINNGAGADNGQLELQTSIDSVLATQITISDNGNIRFHNLPTSSAGLGSGQIWNNGGVLNIV
jgi:hypothetical protein